jgi:pimeloyl-ACP methyl ester carboxylesterase
MVQPLRIVLASECDTMSRGLLMNFIVRSLVLGAGLVLGCQAAANASEKTADCRIGIYRLSDGSDVDIGPSDEGRLRWRRKDGTSGKLSRNLDGSWSSTLGWTGRPDGKRVSFSECDSGEIRFDGLKGQRIAFDIEETHFQSQGSELAGRLVMPQGTGAVPIVALVHGSEQFSARDFYELQRMFPSEGIGTFVYDKRGTGASGGEFTHDYRLLAQDAVAAMREAQRVAGSRAGRIGYHGTSQGGWVAPLAAMMAQVDFVIVGYGLAISPIEEDRAAVELDVTRRGYGPDVVSKALEFADATEAIIVSNFKSGFDRLAAVRAKYGDEPWFKYVHGNITFFMLEQSEATVREQGPILLRGVLPHYDPMPVLRRLSTPQLWILGADDLDAPIDETVRRLHALAASGKPIDIAIFPRAEHGIYEYETTPDGTRLSTRNSEGYFSMMRDYILEGRLWRVYGSSVLQVSRR